jgi:sucrose-6-phosphate hydrolase SacC (GH32 family)
MELKTTNDGIRLYRWPVKEIEDLYIKSYRFKNLSAGKAVKKLAGINAELMDLSIDFEPVSSMKISLRGLDITYEKSSETITFRKSKLSAPAINGKVKLRVLLDRATIELFANEGAAVSTNYAVPVEDNLNISISAEGNLKINSLIINELKSSW